MKLSAIEDKDPAKLKEFLLGFESLFSWDMPETDLPIDVYIKNLTDKCEVIQEEHLFQWTRFIPRLILSYELCEKKKECDIAKEHIDWCVEHLNSLRLNKCQEPLFVGVRDVIVPVLLATRAHILLAAGNVDLAREEADLLFHHPYVNVRYLRSKKNRAGLLGLKAAVYLQYGRADRSRRALEAAKEARNLDPDQAEWWYIVGNALSKIRRFANREVGISTEEVEAVEKAFALQKDASYTAYLAQLYVDYSRQLFINREYNKSKTYDYKAAARFREALQMRPNCSNLKARIAHTMLKMRFKQPLDAPFIKNLLDEVVKTCPNRLMVFCDLGIYYAKIEKDIEKAIFNLKKATEMGSIAANILLSELKWKNGLESQIIEDFKEGLRRCQREEDKAILYAYLGTSHVLVDDDWQSAIPCFQESLDLDPSAKFIRSFKGSHWRCANLLELVTNYLHWGGAAGVDRNMIKSFLAAVAQTRPQTVQLDKNQFINWKKELDKQKGRRVAQSKSSKGLVNSDKRNTHR